MTRHLKTITLGLVIILLFSTLQITIAGGIEIEAEGYGVIQDDLASALDVAIRDAMRRGIEQALGSYLDSHTLVSNFGLVEDSILAKSAGYVSSYYIASQAVQDGLVAVVLVMVVKQADLKDDLDALALGLARKENPRVLVVIFKEERGFLRPGSIAEGVIIEELIKHGFLVVTDNSKVNSLETRIFRAAISGQSFAQATLANLYEAELLVIGKATAHQLANIHGMLSFRGQVQLQAVNLAIKKILTSLTTEEVAPDISPKRAANKALKAAGLTAAGNLIDALADRYVAKDSVISIEVWGITFSELMEIEAGLKRVRLTENVLVRDFNQERAKIEVSTALTARQLANELIRQGKLALDVVSAQGAKLVFQKK